MTGTSPAPSAADPGPATDKDADCRHAAALLRSQHPRWVIIWLPAERCYRARPLFRAPRGTVLTAEAPGELTALMDQVKQAARHPRTRSRQMDT